MMITGFLARGGARLRLGPREEARLSPPGRVFARFAATLHQIVTRREQEAAR